MVEGTAVVGYVRVSTRSQGDNGNGLEAQRQVIQEACNRKGFTLLRIEQDVESGSAKRRDRRPGLDAAIATCRTGEAQAIVAAKLDRISRSAVDFGLLLREAERHGFAVVVLDHEGLDMTTAIGKMVAGVLATFAEFERDRISERTRDALAVVKQQHAEGKRRGKNPPGRPRVIPQSTRERIYRMRHSGMGFRAIAAELNQQGVPAAGPRGWHPSSIARICKTIEAQSATHRPKAGRTAMAAEITFLSEASTH